MAKVPNVLVSAAPAALTAASGLVGGYGVARWSGRRELGGAVLAAMMCSLPLPVSTPKAQ
ncbi:hypothetical protein AB0D22_37675 [Kitasatospora sp. NPDC048538]|uniref:hypothetical protein n=1 Tax=Kitasatospora sp. NPDC048538 TaxID=3155633 RepID=UPI0033C116BA